MQCTVCLGKFSCTQIGKRNFRSFWSYTRMICHYPVFLEQNQKCGVNDVKWRRVHCQQNLLMFYYLLMKRALQIYIQHLKFSQQIPSPRIHAKGLFLLYIYCFMAIENLPSKHHVRIVAQRSCLTSRPLRNSFEQRGHN